jgi:hypothetical protein
MTGSLFGVFHAAAPASAAGCGVLMCNPFGQEAVRSQRVFRVLADRFARSGCATMRFDYYGTGDSDGDDDHASLDTWCADILRADAVLRERSGATRICWLGLRLGGTLAALASARALAPPERLILWDPIVAGPAWLDALAAEHAAALATAFGGAPASVRLPDDDPERAHQSLGFALPKAFRAGVSTIDGTIFTNARADRIGWLSPAVPPAEQSGGRGVAPRSDRVSFRTVAQSSWNTDEAVNAAIVPADVIAAALAELDETMNGTTAPAGRVAATSAELGTS